MNAQAAIRPSQVPADPPLAIAITFGPLNKPIVNASSGPVQRGDQIEFVGSFPTDGTLTIYFGPFDHEKFREVQQGKQGDPFMFGPYSVAATPQSATLYPYGVAFTSSGGVTQRVDPVIIVDPTQT